MTYTAENSEKAFMGCLILEPELVEIVKDRGMSIKWLKDERHKEIFEIIVEAFDQGKALDPNIIVDKGIPYHYMTDLMDAATPAFFDQYAKNIGTARLNEAMKIRIERSPENPELVRSLIDSFDDKFAVQVIKDVKSIAKEKAEDVLSETPEIEMKLPWKDLNLILGGIRRQKLYFLGGLPGHRKTDFAIDIADDLLKQGFNVLYCDYEIGEEDTFTRFFSKRAGIANTTIETRLDEFGNPLTELERIGLSGRINHYSEELDGNLTIVCYPKINEIKNLIKSKNIDAVFIDHIQLFAEEHPIRKDETKPSHINTLCRRLKKLCREMDVAVLCPSQIGRNVQGPPKKSDFKESAGMSENGDVLMGLWWPFAEQKKVNSKGKPCNKNYFEIELAKHRGGPVGRFELYVDVTTGHFTEYTDKQDTNDYRGRREPTNEEL